MMDVHEADGVVPSDTEGNNDGSSSSSTSSSASSTMMLFDKPQPLVLELHELKKTDQTPADKRVPVPPEHARGRRQPITCVTDKTRKLKKKRKPSTASKLTTDSAQANESSLLQALPLPTATTDAAKEEFFDAQDTVMPPENESDSKTSELAAADIEATMDAIAKDLDVPLRLNLPGHSQETDQLVPPAITEPFDAPPAPEAKMDAPQELVTTGIVGKELSQTNVKGIIQPQSMTSHRSIKKPVDRLEPQV